MIQIFFELIKNFRIGLVVFDKELNIICFNHVIEEDFGFSLSPERLSNLAQIHSPKALKQISQMTKEAEMYQQSSNYILKIFPTSNKKNKIFLGKVFLLKGYCPNRFIAILYETTNLMTEGQNIVKLPVYEGNNLLFLDLKDISFLKATGNYTEIIYKQKLYLCPLSLARIEKRLDPKMFIRVHRSFIVNTHHIKKLLKEEGKNYILLRDKQIIPVSKKKLRDLLGLFGLK